VIWTITTAYCKNLTIDATANLTIQSSATGTGSLIVKGSVTGNANVQRYLTGYAFHIVSPPVLEQSIPAFLTTNSLVDAIPVTGIRALKHYIESSDNWGQYYNNSTTGFMENANGYVTYLKADGTISFSGKLQSGPTTVTVTRDKNG
jgi:hypothetical protein